MIDILFLGRDIPCMPRYILPSEKSSVTSRVSSRIPIHLVTFIVFSIILHSPSVLPSVNYTRQFVMLIHNYTLCTIAVRPPFRPTLP